MMNNIIFKRFISYFHIIKYQEDEVDYFQEWILNRDTVYSSMILSAINTLPVTCYAISQFMIGDNIMVLPSVILTFTILGYSTWRMIR